MFHDLANGGRETTRKVDGCIRLSSTPEEFNNDDDFPSLGNLPVWTEALKKLVRGG